MSDDLTSEVTEAEGTEGAADATTPDAGGLDLSRLEQRMEEQSRQTAEQLGQFREMFEQAFVQPDDDDYDEDQYPLDEGDEGWEEQEFQRIIDERAEQIARSIVEQQLGPMQAREQAREFASAAESVAERYHDLYDDKGQTTDLAEQVMSAAAQTAARFGIDHRSDPRFWDLFDLAYAKHKTEELARRETPAGRNQPVLETGGASSGNRSTQQDEQEAFIKHLTSRSENPLL